MVGAKVTSATGRAAASRKTAVKAAWPFRCESDGKDGGGTGTPAGMAATGDGTTKRRTPWLNADRSADPSLKPHAKDMVSTCSHRVNKEEGGMAHQRVQVAGGRKQARQRKMKIGAGQRRTRGAEVGGRRGRYAHPRHRQQSVSGPSNGLLSTTLTHARPGGGGGGRRRCHAGRARDRRRNTPRAPPAATRADPYVTKYKRGQCKSKIMMAAKRVTHAASGTKMARCRTWARGGHTAAARAMAARPPVGRDAASTAAAAASLNAALAGAADTLGGRGVVWAADGENMARVAAAAVGGARRAPNQPTSSSWGH